MQIQTNPQTTELPTAAAVVTHEVADYSAWKKVFDQHAGSRRAAGIFQSHINRLADNSNVLAVYLGARDAAKLKAFLGSQDLKQTMSAAGVKGAPEVKLITPVEDLTIKDRALAGAVLIHEAADYAAWKPVFDGHATTRAEAGIVGHAVNRSSENPNLVVVYLQAQSRDALQAFTQSADLKTTMQKAGVKGPPQIVFTQGQPWES